LIAGSIARYGPTGPWRFDFVSSVLRWDGQPLEELWPYGEPNDPNPGSDRLTVALREVGHTPDDLRHTLDQDRPIAVGFVLTDQFFTPKDGWVDLDPNDTEAGRHAAVLVGYTSEPDAFVMRNSWGTSWGRDGHARLSTAFVKNRVEVAWDLAVIGGSP
jgi:hypothetical protein